MSRYLKVGLLVALAMLGGCATMPSPAAQRVAEVGAGMVSACHLLGTVRGTSKLDGIGQATGVKNAQTEAREQAAKWGANAVVWTQVTQRYWGYEMVSGDAYKCNSGVVSGAQ